MLRAGVVIRRIVFPFSLADRVDTFCALFLYPKNQGV